LTKYRILLTADAERDMEGICDYIAEHDLPEKADHVLAKLQKVVDGLRNSPNRGSIPKELLSLGISEYREVYFNPYRIVYRVVGKTIYVYLIADGRRNMETLLARRLLEG